MSATKSSVWSNPAEALKAIVSGVITFAGAVVLSLSTNADHTVPTAPSMMQWLTAAVFGLGALVTTYWVPNKQAAVLAVEKVAVDVVTHNPQQAATDATAVVDQYWKQMFVKGGVAPPVPVVVSTEPVSTVAGVATITPAPAVAAAVPTTTQGGFVGATAAPTPP